MLKSLMEESRTIKEELLKIGLEVEEVVEAHD